MKKRKSYKDLIPIGPPRLTAYERARIVGIRAIQIQFGSPLFIEGIEETDPIKIAEIELEKRVLPLSIKRKLFHREDFPPIPVNWLLKAEEEDLHIEV
jgi:DNA-directed RNA polymerase I, II, and III subunit RPABC2/DNA-directed RNA polymerase subunit K